ncbi:MAG TPA: aminotransferase class I/II-fold pyridoxal phosphate-dependent enzyme [Solirubrobacteraceae bacterium]|nr:aminotransferase class I/II-fold pyridoxal phosphate-dependent enzyme [Solirubrobacteraceae bacterium]
MDPQVAATLAELERKLDALERTLSALGHPAEPPVAAAPAPAGEASWGRIVDEYAPAAAPAAPPPAATTLSAPPPPAPVATPAPSWTPPPAAPSWTTPAAAERSPASAPAGAPTAVHASDPAPAPSPAGRPETISALAPGAAELLRFRERLESTVRDLAHEYDALLGRLSYAAMPTATQSTISFARGVPSLDIIDVEGLRDSAVGAFEADPEGTTAYGTSVGYPRLRAWIADRHGVEPERVLVTNGSLQADAFLFDQLVGGGDEVVVEKPTYDRTLLGLKQRGAIIHAVALEHDGIDTDALARLLAGGARPKLAHVIPNFQNPAGYTLSAEKRRALVALANEYGFYLLEDDPYAELRFSGAPQPTMLSLSSERVVYASSFTKTVCPGVRVGYLVGPPELIAGIANRATNTYISPGMVAEAIVYEFCASGRLERSIETVRTALAERAHTLAAALRRELPDADFVEPQGGYFMWVTLPEGTDVDALFTAAGERGVAFVKGSDFMTEGGGNALRLAYSGVTPEQIEVGIARLAEAYRSL